VYKFSGTNVVFQTAIFLILVVRNNKRYSGIDSKTSSCCSRSCWFSSYLELRFCYLFSELSEPVIVVFPLISWW